MTKHLTLFWSLFSVLMAFGQSNTQSIFGKIVDLESKEVLFGATVYVLDSDPIIGATTDFDGNYRLDNVPVGRVSLYVSYLGYEDQAIQELMLTSGKALNIDVQLRESLQNIQEVTVLAKKENESFLKVDNDMATVSAMSFTIAQSTRYAGSNNDPSRLALSLPGVRNQGDIQNGISIRGNSPTALLWTIEGLEVQSPNHFAREGALGAVNMISGPALKNVDFYTAAFPAQYANAGSGVFDLHYQKGNNEEYEGSFAIGTLGTEASIEGPFSKNYKGSFKLVYRYSTLGILSKLGYSFGGDFGPVYQDFNYNLDLPTKHFGKFQIFGLVGDSYIRPLEASKDNYSMWSDDYRMSLVGIKNTQRVSDKTFLKTTLAYSQSKGKYSEVATNERYRTNNKQEEIYNGEKFNQSSFPILEKRLQLDLKSSTKYSAQHSIQAGLNVTYIDFYQSYSYSNDVFSYNSRQSELEYKRTDSDSSLAETQTMLLKAFFQHKYRFTENLSVTGGLSFLHLHVNKFFAIEPRIGLEYNYGKGHQLTLGFGMHSRLESLGFYTNQSTYYNVVNYRNFSAIQFEESYGSVNQFVGATRSLQGVIGKSFKLAKDLRFKSELYLQYLYNVPVELYPTFLPAYSAINYQYPSFYSYNFLAQAEYANYGRGLNYGIDLSLEKSFSKNYYFLINSSLYQSKFRTPYSPLFYKKKWLNTRYNGNFILSVTGGKDFKIGKDKNNTFGLNMRSLWAGNNRVDDEITFEPFANRLSNYFRIDTRVAYTRNKEKYSWTLSLDLQNVTNRINESSNPVINSAGLLPFLNYKVDW